MHKALLSTLAIAFALSIAAPALAAPRAGEVIKVTNETSSCVFVVVTGHQPDRPDTNSEHAMMKPRAVEYFLNRGATVGANVYLSVHENEYCGRPVKGADFDLFPTAAKRNIRVFATTSRSRTERSGYDIDLY